MADTFGNTNGVPPSSNVPATEFGRSVERDPHNSAGDAQAGRSTAEPGLKEKLTEDLNTVKETAKDVAHKATDAAERQKGYAADQIGKIANALERVGEELKSDDAGAVGTYAAQLGSSARRIADQVKDKSFGEIASVAEDFGRRQPLAFLGLAAVAGLAASRFLMASKPSSTPTISRSSGENYNG